MYRMTYRVNTDRIIFTQLGNEGVVYEMEKNDYVTLNETMFEILSGLEQGKTPPDLVAQFCREYQIDEADCLHAVNEAVAELVANGYVTAQPHP